MLNKPISISHPMADEISRQDSEFHHARHGVSSELAFFKNGKWVIDPLPEFAEYHDGSTSEYDTTAVYDYVPNDLVYEFLARYAK